MQRARWLLVGMVVTLGALLAGGVALMYSGIYNVAATSGHTRLVHWVLERGMKASVDRHSAPLRAPSSLGEASIIQGARCFDLHCVQCHGAPGRSPAAIGKGLLPNAKSLVQTARDWPIEKIYWVTRHGIRMAGMPAWQFRLGDSELWAVAAFVDRELPMLTVEQYGSRVAAVSAYSCGPPVARAPPDAMRGQLTIRQYGCHGCHMIPGISGSTVHVGPSLRGFATRPLIAGALPNTPDNLLRWLQHPQSVRPRTLMPDLGVTEQHARDIQAYLETLD